VDVLTVKYIGMDRGKIKLSRKALLPGGSDEDDNIHFQPWRLTRLCTSLSKDYMIYRNRYIIVTNELHKDEIIAILRHHLPDGKVGGTRPNSFMIFCGPGPGSGVHGL
jgi:hypothetical protein